MRVIVRREVPHPGSQLRSDDVEGYRLTGFATNPPLHGFAIIAAGGTPMPPGQLADLELPHRRCARCEDRIRIAKDTSLTNLPLKGFAANQVWLLAVQLAADLLAFTGPSTESGTSPTASASST